MSIHTQIQTIQFYNQSLVTFEQNGTYYTAMKPICENIGLAWNAQLLRIKRDEVLSKGMIVMITPTNGGEQEMVCLPIQYLNGWLFGIDTNRVKPEIRETLIKYKKECYQALHDYWFKGKAERTQTTVDDRTGLRDAVNMLVSKKGLIYSDAYQLVHHRFNVKSIEELSKEQLPQAVEYVHKIVLEGELIEPSTLQLSKNTEATLEIM
ncbi:phage antirepressor N-terminal domain-containing protein, partial [Gallibacterium sp. AGMB14963]|uniref:phage antirepressor N-terminal domain-containing protein n=1 Tax=Gallibacterium faecale TaxID=3019086 RepID=UPI0022F16E8F